MPPDGVEQLRRRGGLGDDRQPPVGLQQHPQPVPQQRLVVGQHDPHRRGPVTVAREPDLPCPERPTRVERAQLFRCFFSRTRTEIRTGLPTKPKSSRNLRSRNRR